MSSLATSLPVAQWLEGPIGVREVMVFIPIGDSDFSLCHANGKLNVACLLFLSEFKIYHLSIFINTHGAFDFADPRSMQDACQNEPRPRSSRASQ